MAEFDFSPNNGLIIGWKMPDKTYRYVNGDQLDNVFGIMMMDCLPDSTFNEFFGISGALGCPYYTIIRDTLRYKGIPKLANCKDGHSPQEMDIALRAS